MSLHPLPPKKKNGGDRESMARCEVITPNNAVLVAWLRMGEYDSPEVAKVRN